MITKIRESNTMLPSARFTMDSQPTLSSHNNSSSSASSSSYYSPLPFFERLENNEANELLQQKEIIDSMKTRMKRLEDMNLDLEYRLQDQGRQCMTAEKECFEIRKEWSQKCQSLELEIKKWKDECHAQQLKTEKMKDHLSRTERELYGILQKKYDFIRNQGPSGGGAPSGAANASNGNSSGSGPTTALLSGSNSRSTGHGLSQVVDVTSGDADSGEPEDYSLQEERQRSIATSLADFLGI